jgi:ketosteroid isomerase-like protein
MGATDLEILREMWEEIGGPAPDRLGEELVERWWHPEIEYVEDPRWPGSGTYRGREDAAAAWNGYLDVFGSVEMNLENLFDGGELLVATVRMRAISRGGKIPVEHLWAYIYRLQDGQIVYMRAYSDPEEALAAAGVDSP